MRVREDLTITEKGPTRAFSWLEGDTSAFTFNILLRRYAEQAPKYGKVGVKLGCQHNYHKGQAALVLCLVPNTCSNHAPLL